MNRDDAKTFLGAGIFALFLLCATFAFADDKLPAGYTCEQVRANVERYGKIAAWTWARLNGLSREQIAAARRCLK